MRLALDLAQFVGRWQVHREIEDMRSGLDGVFVGLAEFTPSSNGVIYDETGQIQMANQAPLKADRRYIWVANGDHIDVLFEDGRAFHPIDLSHQAAKAAHFCDPDQYDVTYDFSSWPRWQTVWDVSGPRKRYRLTTHYQRV